MPLSPRSDQSLAESEHAEQARQLLHRARRSFHELPAGALAEAVRCCEIAHSIADDSLCVQAYALQAMVSLHRGDLHGALELVEEAEMRLDAGDRGLAAVDVASAKAQLALFSGSYADALLQAERAVSIADGVGELCIRVYARRETCPVFGTLDGPDLRERIEELLELAIESGDPWEQALSRNDLAFYLAQHGDPEAAEIEIGLALELAHQTEATNHFTLGVLHSTRADIMLALRRPEDALADAARSMESLRAGGDPNPYVLAATVRADVEARMALGRLDDAARVGEGALDWLGDRVPATRSVILSTLASSLRNAGRLEDAYDALARSAELEREAFRELSELQRRLERATLQARAARETSAELAAKNRQLAEAHDELAFRARDLEALQGELRDQADRDWLTGLHNRRYLAKEVERLAGERRAGSFSLAAIDLDGFKAINDNFGHDLGDEVLVRVATLLREVLRDSDVVVRSGGEEFLVLMPLTDVSAAAAACERVCEAIREEPWDRLTSRLTVTASIGVASTNDAQQVGLLASVADRHLYEAKRAGRDCVVCAQQSPARV